MARSRASTVGRHHRGPRRDRLGPALVTIAAVLAAAAIGTSAAAVITVAKGLSSRTVDGASGASQWIDTAGALPAVTRVPADDELPHATAYGSIVAAVIDDLDSYWSTELPAISTERFSPLRGGLTALDSAAMSGTAPCVNTPAQISGNAYYCPSKDAIVYDSSALLPVLIARYGVPGVVGTFAHEFGHAIQERIGPTSAERRADPADLPSLLIELQSDCDVGAFLTWLDAERHTRIHLDDAAALQVIAPILDFADAPTTAPDDPTAHGMAVDRLRAVVRGHRGGAGACHAMTATSIDPVLGSVEAPDGGSATLATPRFDSHAEVIAAAARSLATLTGTDIDPANLDEGAITDSPAWVAATPYGQFAQAATVAWQVGQQQDAARPACVVGAWTAAVYGHGTARTLGGWPSDADEALAAVRHRPGATFADLAAFVDGFDGGLAACDP